MTKNSNNAIKCLKNNISTYNNHSLSYEDKNDMITDMITLNSCMKESKKIDSPLYQSIFDNDKPKKRLNSLVYNPHDSAENPDKQTQFKKADGIKNSEVKAQLQMMNVANNIKITNFFNNSRTHKLVESSSFGKIEDQKLLDTQIPIFKVTSLHHNHSSSPEIKSFNRLYKNHGNLQTESNNNSGKLLKSYEKSSPRNESPSQIKSNKFYKKQDMERWVSPPLQSLRGSDINTSSKN